MHIINSEFRDHSKYYQLNSTIKEKKLAYPRKRGNKV